MDVIKSIDKVDKTFKRDVDMLVKLIQALQNKGRHDIASGLSGRLKTEIEKEKMVNDKERKEQLKVRIAPLYTPRKIKAHLDKFVIGQEKAKRVLAVAGYKHMLRFDAAFHKEEGAPVKNNVILIGGTGTGKTYMCKVLADFLELPFGTSDMSRITQSGYVGQDISTVTTCVEHGTKEGTTYLQQMHSIILLDEIDKICTTESGGVGNVGTTPVQHELLTLIEGIPAPTVGNTGNVLFIGAGSFGGTITEEKFIEEKSMAFGSTTEITAIPINEQLVEYGMIPELVGRFQSGSTLQNLSVANLVTIMKSSKESILTNFVEMFKREGIELKITRGAMESIATAAIRKKTGARALNSTLECVLADIQFDILGSGIKDDIVLTKKFVDSKLNS